MSTIASYKQALETLNGHARRKLKNNTYLEMHPEENYIAVRLHATDVVRYFSDGRVQLNSGGWQTVTTKDRLNEYSPFHVTQRAHKWTLYPPMNDLMEGANGIKFEDGMHLREINGVWQVFNPSSDTLISVLAHSSPSEKSKKTKVVKETIFEGEEI